MAPSGVTSNEKTSPKWHGWAVMAMLVCLAVSIISAAEVLIPGWSGDDVFIGIILIAIEAIYSFRVLRLPRSRGISILRYRLAEACLLGIVLELITYLGHTWNHSWADIESDVMTILWQPSAFFSRHYMILCNGGLGRLDHHQPNSGGF